jgi:hypothetical protein
MKKDTANVCRIIDNLIVDSGALVGYLRIKYYEILPSQAILISRGAQLKRRLSISGQSKGNPRFLESL